MRKQKTLNQKKIWIKGMLGVFTVLMTFGFSSFLSFAAEGKVTADTAKIRAEANTSSEVVGSTSKGKTIDIIEAVKDASGAVWYKVPIGNNEYGYIRSDLVETSETIEATGGSSGSSENNSSGSDSNEATEKPAATVPTAIGEQQATVSQASVRIRAGASIQHDTVTSLPQGTAITLIGEANDSAGNKWYQLTCNYNNKTVEGYIRSDLITIGGTSSSGSNSGSSENTDNEAANTADGEGEVPEGEGEVPEGEGETDPEGEPEAEAPEPEPEHNDYEVRYTQNEEGEYEYYLYDNINGTMQKLGNLLGVVDSANANIAKMQEQANNAKIIIIILAVVVVLLVVAVTVLIFKIRDLSYDDYDYEEEEEEEEEEPVVRRKVKRTVEEEESVPVRKKRPVSQEASGTRERTAKQPSSRTAGERPSNPVRSSNSTRPSGGARPARPKNPEAELHAAERKAPVKKQESRKAQNFLVDDDEFEFEFLNMDDKDL